MSRYSVKVNGAFVTNVDVNQVPTYNELTAFVKTFGVDFDDTKDTLEVECIDATLTPVLVFPTNAWMQVEKFAIETHVKNLIATYGLESVIQVLDETFEIGRAS
jgi:hypothetical protein